ncbi:hypothetical protein Taro_007786 [Colocasia esculenta]|uniref:Uncharacterized protein n=1 Tax=Colocasia esculenta TaxID=4460 RepID=A0A843U0J1_COLES|nr:hypothetical protein [Colocasia esculenta]
MYGRELEASLRAMDYCQFLEDCFFCNFLRWSDATEAGVSPLPPAFSRAAEKFTIFTSRDQVLCMEYLAANFPGLVSLWAMLASLLVEVVEVAISVVPILEAVLVVDPDPEGDLMWWQCQQPPCFLRSEVGVEKTPSRSFEVPSRSFEVSSRSFASSRDERGEETPAATLSSSLSYCDRDRGEQQCSSPPSPTVTGKGAADPFLPPPISSSGSGDGEVQWLRRCGPGGATADRPGGGGPGCSRRRRRRGVLAAAAAAREVPGGSGGSEGPFLRGGPVLFFLPSAAAQNRGPVAPPPLPLLTGRPKTGGRSPPPLPLPEAEV